MKVEVRNGKAYISGYVNAVGRDSDPIPTPTGGQFVEMIEPGAFREALTRAKNVDMCSSVYWAGADSSVKKYIKDNADKIGKVVNISTAAMIESTYSQIKKVCEQAGVTISDNEFHCRGKFAAVHSGHPDDADIQAVKEFAKKVTGEA